MSNYSKAFAAAGLLAATVLVAAGCGGGSGDATDTSAHTGATAQAPLTKRQFVSQANAVCRERNADVLQLTAPTYGSSPSSVASFLGQYVAISSRAYQRLLGIKPPAELKARYSQYLRATKSQLRVARRAQQAWSSNEFHKAFRLIPKPFAKKSDALTRAKSLGLTACATRAVPPRNPTAK